MTTTANRHLRLSAAALLGGAALAAVPTAPAMADAPLVVEDVRFDGTPELDEGLTDHCGFPVTVETTGHFRGTVYFDSQGEFRRFTGHPSMAETFTSPFGSFESSDRGVDKISITQDGDLLIFGTGIHLKVDGQVYAIGLWRLTVDLDTDELIAQEYHGNFDVTEPEIGDRICALLGPTG
jgi:hypothetical protein